MIGKLLRAIVPASLRPIGYLENLSRKRTGFTERTTPGTSLLPGSYVDWAVSEWRPVRMAWFWMVPR